MKLILTFVFLVCAAAMADSPGPYKLSIIGERFYKDSSIPALGEAYRCGYDRVANTSYYPAYSVIWGSPVTEQNRPVLMSQSSADRYCKSLNAELPTRGTYGSLAALLGYESASGYSIYAKDGTELLPGSSSSDYFWTSSTYETHSGNVLSYSFESKSGIANFDHYANGRGVRCIVRTENCSPSQPLDGIDGEWSACVPITFNYFGKFPPYYSNGHESVRIDFYIKKKDGGYTVFDSGIYYAAKIYSNSDCSGEMVRDSSPDMQDYGFRLKEDSSGRLLVQQIDKNAELVDLKEPRWKKYYQPIVDPQNTYTRLDERVMMKEVGQLPKFSVQIGSDYWLKDKTGKDAIGLTHASIVYGVAHRIPTCPAQ